MKFHFAILTSREAWKAYRCYRTILDQRDHNFIVEVTVVVNTLDQNYFDEVVEEFKNDDINVIETPSNGSPGKGKNSALTWLLNTDADYVVALDGDDFIYPLYLHLLEPLMKAGHEYIAGISSDMWKGNHLYATWGDKQPNNPVKTNRDIIQGRDYQLWESHTIDRMYAIKREKLAEMPSMPEDLDLYEDFVYTCALTKMYMSGDLNYVRVNSSYIYAYDSSGDSQCTIFVKDKDLAEKNMNRFWEYADVLKPVFFSRVPFIELPTPKFDKLSYVKDLNVVESI